MADMSLRQGTLKAMPLHQAKPAWLLVTFRGTIPSDMEPVDSLDCAVFCNGLGALQVLFPVLREQRREGALFHEHTRRRNIIFSNGPQKGNLAQAQ